MTRLASTPPARLAYRIDEACAAVGIGRDALYAAIRDGRLRARKYGRLTLIAHDDLARFIADLPELELGEEGEAA